MTEEYVRAVKEQTEADRLAELIDGAPMQARVIPHALTRLTQSGSNDEFSMKAIFSASRSLIESIHMKPLSERRVREILE